VQEKGAGLGRRLGSGVLLLDVGGDLLEGLADLSELEGHLVEDFLLEVALEIGDLLVAVVVELFDEVFYESEGELLGG